MKFFRRKKVLPPLHDTRGWFKHYDKDGKGLTPDEILFGLKETFSPTTPNIDREIEFIIHNLFPAYDNYQVGVLYTWGSR